MSDWKGPNKCQKCGRIIEHLADFRNDIHLGGVGWCDGTWELYDRRAPADGVVEEVRMARDAIVDGRPWDAQKLLNALLSKLGGK